VEMTFRWFGRKDPVDLKRIRQIPGVSGIVSAVYDVRIGGAWTRESVNRLVDDIDSAGMHLSVVESIPVHEDIKLGRPTRDKLVDNYAESIKVVAEAGVPVVCYNFMPVFDWTRTDLAMRLEDGSTALAFDDDDLSSIDLARGTGDLPGWAAAYSASELKRLLDAYKQVSTETLWDNLTWFLERIVPVAESEGVKLALHPDDPPWSIFGLPRIITDRAALERVIGLVDSEANGITFCTGSLGASADNDLPAMIRAIGSRIHFAHCRNVKRTGHHDFHEVPHPSRFGDVDMFDVLSALHEAGFNGPIRPDHGRMIWGETGRAGYGLYDRALGATYLQGLWEGVARSRSNGGAAA
jgi:mannonate dehydratase